MPRVSDILSRKGSSVHSVDKTVPVFDAVKKMVEANVGSLVILDGDAICGIFTERDYLRRIVLQGKTSKDTKVEEVMTARLVVVDKTRDVEECMSIMTTEKIRHLPVIDEQCHLVGLVSIGDLVKHLSKERKAEIQYLTDYITGKYPA
jgi:CBS domain-containing protein